MPEPTAFNALAAVLMELEKRELLGDVLASIDEKWTGVGGVVIMSWWRQHRNGPRPGLPQ